MYVENLKKYFWIPRNRNRVLVSRVDPYIRSVPGGGSVMRPIDWVADWLTFYISLTQRTKILTRPDLGTNRGLQY